MGWWIAKESEFVGEADIFLKRKNFVGLQSFVRMKAHTLNFLIEPELTL